MTSPIVGPPEPAALPAWKATRRKAIIDAAKRALRRQRYEQIQIKDVADKAGVALATLYRYFSSKEELYVAVLVEATKPSGAPPRDPATAADLVRSRVHLVLAAYEKDPSHFALSVSLHRSNDPAVLKRLAEWDRWSTTWLVDGVESRGGADVADLARMLWPIVYAGLSAAIVHEGTFDEARRLADEFVSMIADQIEFADG